MIQQYKKSNLAEQDIKFILDLQLQEYITYIQIYILMYQQSTQQIKESTAHHLLDLISQPSKIGKTPVLQFDHQLIQERNIVQYQIQINVQKRNTFFNGLESNDVCLLRSTEPKIIQNPKQYPYSAVGIVKCISNNGFTTGTGCLIGPKTVLTCAQIFYQDKKAKTEIVYFVPASLATKNLQGFKAKKVCIPQRYKNTQMQIEKDKHLQNYALIQLDTQCNLEEYFGSIGYDLEWQESNEHKKGVKQTKLIQDLKIIGFPQVQQLKQYSGNAYIDAKCLIHTMEAGQSATGAPVIQAIHIQNKNKNLLQASFALALDKRMYQELKKTLTIDLQTCVYRKIMHSRLGDIKVFKPQKYQDQVIQITKTVHSYQKFNQWLSKNNKITNQTIKELILLPKNTSSQFNNLNSLNAVVNLKYDYYHYTLHDQLSSRRGIGFVYFEGKQIWLLLYNLIRIEACFQSDHQTIGNVHPKNILIDDNGQIKLFAKNSFPPQFQNDQQYNGDLNLLKNPKESCFFAPQEFQYNQQKLMDLNKIDASIAECYSIGMCVLAAGTLKNIDQVYQINGQKRKINQNKVNQYLTIFSQKYTRFLHRILKSLLNPNPQNRKKCSYWFQILYKYQNQILDQKFFMASEDDNESYGPMNQNFSWGSNVFGKVKLFKKTSSYDQQQIKFAVQNEQVYNEWLLESNKNNNQKTRDLIILPTKTFYQSGFAYIRCEDYCYNLQLQLQNRLSIGQFFEEPQIWLMVYQIITAGSIFEKNRQKIGNISPSSIMINKIGNIKFLTKYSFPGFKDNFQTFATNPQAIVYLAPEQLQLTLDNIEYPKNVDPSTAQCYSIGLCILAAGNLVLAYSIYETNQISRKINKEKLNNYLQIFEKRYSRSILSVVTGLLAENPINRKKCSQIYEVLLKYEEKILNRQPFQLNSQTFKA